MSPTKKECQKICLTNNVDTDKNQGTPIDHFRNNANISDNTKRTTARLDNSKNA